MKVVRTVVVFDKGNFIESESWKRMHEMISTAIRKIVPPPGNGQFVIRRKIHKLDHRGVPSRQWLRNGVVPIKQQFLANLADRGWRAEMPVRLGHEVLAKAKPLASAALIDFPSGRRFTLGDAAWIEVFREGLGDFDFYSETPNGIRRVVEWETGNISSSHRTMNKLCLVTLAGLIDIGILILPTQAFYRHLTDRVGNWEELSPYFIHWHLFGQTVERGLLAVMAVEHDRLTDDPHVPFIRHGTEGRSAEGVSKLG